MSKLDTAQLEGTPTITEALQGRTVDYVEENDHGGVNIVCTDGRIVKLGIARSAENGRWSIKMFNISTLIALSGLGAGSQQGLFGGKK